MTHTLSMFAKIDWQTIQDWFSTIWHYQVITSGDRSIEVSQIVIAMGILLVGLVVAKRVTRGIGQRLTRHKRFDHTASLIVEKILFYTLIVIVVLYTLHVINVPLTMFAFLGGAVAIGLGFGAQAIVNNFISGLILMLEQPIRVRDLIEIDDHLGVVEEIGARCTRVRRTDGIHVLVPNSKLLENNVINWTLVDDRIRAKVTVGVVYGSPTDKVNELIRKAVDENENILKDPTPIILFDDFGNDALIFEVYFWAEVRTEMQLRKISSQLRFHIDAMFREANLVIAFPQRDVHLDTIKPLEVRVLSGNDANTAKS